MVVGGVGREGGGGGGSSRGGRFYGYLNDTYQGSDGREGQIQHGVGLVVDGVANGGRGTDAHSIDRVAHGRHVHEQFVVRHADGSVATQ